MDRKIPVDIKEQSKKVGEQLALNALTTEVFILRITKILEGKFRKYIGGSQFPMLVKDYKPHKGVPDFVSKEDLASKVRILKNAVTDIINTEGKHKQEYESMGKFRRFIEENILFNRNEDCCFSRKAVCEYIEDEDWDMLHTILSCYKPKLIILRQETMTILNSLGNKLMINAAYISGKMWKEHVHECFHKHGGKRFKHISQEDKAYITVTNEAANTYGISPDQHLEMQASQWESKWHRAVDKINKAIYAILEKLINLAKQDRDIDNTLDVEKYDNSIKGYPKDTKEWMYGHARI